MVKITILDTRVERILACEQAVRKALRKLDMEAAVTQISEPPHLTRLNVWERLPALDIDGLIWSRKSEKAFTSQEVIQLLEKHYLKRGVQGR